MRSEAEAGSVIAPPAKSSASAGSWLLAAALLSAVLLTLPARTAGPLVLDEHVSYWIIEAGPPGDVWARCRRVAATPPLFSWVQQASVLAAGKSEWALRLPSLAGYVLAVLATAVVGRRLAGPHVGGLAALVLAWHPEVVDEVRIGRCYGLLLLLAALLLLATLWWRERPIALLRAGVWSLAAAAVVWTHYLGAPLVAMSWLTVGWPRPSGWKQVVAMLLGGAAFAVSVLPLLPAIERLAAWGPFLNYQVGSPSLGSLFGPFWWLGAPLALVVAWFLSYLLSMHWPATGTWRSRLTAALFHPVWLPLLWSLLPLLMLYVAAQGDRSSLANPRYRVPYGVGAACLMATALPTRRQPWLAASCAVLGLSVSWMMSERSPGTLGRLGESASSDWREIAATIETRGQAGEPVFVQGGLVESHLVPIYCQDEVFLEYVACRMSRFYLPSPHPRYGLPFLWDSADVVACFRQRIAAELAQGQRVMWVACATDSDLNRLSGDGLEHLLAEAGFVRTQEWTLTTAVLQRWEGP